MASRRTSPPPWQVDVAARVPRGRLPCLWLPAEWGLKRSWSAKASCTRHGPKDAGTYPWVVFTRAASAERVSENGEVSFWAAEQPGEYELPEPLANRSIWLAMRRTLRGLPSAGPGLPRNLSSEAVGNWAPSPARVPFLNNKRRSTPARQINYAVSRAQVKWVPGPTTGVAAIARGGGRET